MAFHVVDPHPHRGAATAARRRAAFSPAAGHQTTSPRGSTIATRGGVLAERVASNPAARGPLLRPILQTCPRVNGSAPPVPERRLGRDRDAEELLHRHPTHVIEKRRARSGDASRQPSLSAKCRLAMRHRIAVLTAAEPHLDGDAPLETSLALDVGLTGSWPFGNPFGLNHTRGTAGS